MNEEDIKNHNLLWFKKTYNSLIDKGKKRGLDKKKLDYYTERHHIIPKSIGGLDIEDNYVLLTYREHIIAHILLIRIYPDNYGLAHAVKTMLMSKKNHNIYSDNRRDSFTTKELDEIRQKSSKWLSESRKGIPKSEETKRKMSEARKGIKPSQKTLDAARKASIGRKQSKETIEKRVLKLKGRKLTRTDRLEASIKRRVGSSLSEEHKRKISESRKGLVPSEESKRKRSGVNSFMSKKVIGPDGTVYSSIKECSDKVKIPQTTLKNYLVNKPEKGFRYLNPSESRSIKTIKVQDPNGIVYNSIHDCARAFGKADPTIKKWIEKYPEKGFKYYTEKKD